MNTSLAPVERDSLRQHLDRIQEERHLNVLDRRRIEELAGIESDDGPVVSVYLDLGPEARLRRAWATALKTHARDALVRLGDQAAGVEPQIQRVEEELDNRIPRLGRGVAIFSCPGLDLWEVFGLPVPLPNRVEVNRRPLLRPLLRVRDEHELYLVVLLDKRRARLFLSQHGTLTEVYDLFEDTPAHHAKGGWSQMRWQRHHDAHVLWHAGAVAWATAAMMDRFGAPHLLVSGTEEVLAEYKEHLPSAVAGRLAGRFHLHIEAEADEILEAIGPLVHETVAHEEQQTIRKIHNAVSAGKGVWGVADTLRAVTEQRVMVLLCADEYRVPGGECGHCGMLTVAADTNCPSCDQDLIAVDDVVDLALERAFRQDARVELVRSEPARSLLAEAAPIGALLRY